MVLNPEVAADNSEDYINANHMKVGGAMISHVVQHELSSFVLLQSNISIVYLQHLLPGSPEFVVAQGPLPNTIGHFWKMISQVLHVTRTFLIFNNVHSYSQQRSRIIVMLSETDPKKCAVYWPKETERLQFAADNSGPQVSVEAIGVRNNPAWYFMCSVLITFVSHHL